MGAVFLALLHVDGELDLAAGGRGELILDGAEIAADQREEVAGFGVGIMPDGVMAARAGLAGFLQVAVGEQDRRLFLRRFDARGEHGHHVGPVEVIGDAPEPSASHCVQ